MYVRTIVALLAVVLAPTLAIAASNVPPAAIAKLTNTIIDGTTRDDASVFAGIFTDDATVVDENEPFAWRGAGAGIAWWHVVEAVTQKARITHLKATGVRNGEFRSSATDAYLVQSMTITGARGGKPFAEPGTLTYTFHNASGKWLISSMVWTTKP
jgi:ketosteroid isomerase-like protein